MFIVIEKKLQNRLIQKEDGIKKKKFVFEISLIKNSMQWELEEYLSCWQEGFTNQKHAKMRDVYLKVKGIVGMVVKAKNILPVLVVQKI